MRKEEGMERGKGRGRWCWRGEQRENECEGDMGKEAERLKGSCER